MHFSRFFLGLCCSVFFLIGSCGQTPLQIEDHWLDSTLINDPSLTDNSYLVSSRFPTPNAATLATPVIIAVHGFSASTYEWQEFKPYAEATANVFVSLVLLGAHGRNYDVFKKSTWQDWGTAIIEEYTALVEKGYTNISLVGSSAGGTLLLEYLSNGFFDQDVKPKSVTFIDSLVVVQNKSLYLVPPLKPLLGEYTASKSDSTTEDMKHWYQIDPMDALFQLELLIGRVKKHLEKGVILPEGTRAQLFQSQKDPTVDPISALLIYNGLKTSNGQHIDVQTLDTELHVFTRLVGRDDVSDQDRANQIVAFDAIIKLAE